MTNLLKSESFDLIRIWQKGQAKKTPADKSVGNCSMIITLVLAQNHKSVQKVGRKASVIRQQHQAINMPIFCKLSRWHTLALSIKLAIAAIK